MDAIGVLILTHKVANCLMKVLDVLFVGADLVVVALGLCQDHVAELLKHGLVPAVDVLHGCHVHG